MNCAFPKAVRALLAAAFTFSALPALAADLYSSYGYGSKDYPPAEVTPPLWSGFYLGVNGGYAYGGKESEEWAKAQARLDANEWLVPGSYWTDGGFGGLQFGYNVQHHHLVMGLETDIQGGVIGGKKALQVFNGDGSVDARANASNNLDWFGTVRGRAGYAFGGTLVYGTAGFAYGGMRDTLNLTVSSTNPGNPGTAVPFSKTRDSTKMGYAVGAGVETAITPSWSLKAEYQYIDFGNSAFAVSGPVTVTGGSDTGGASGIFDHSYHTLRFGVNYKFNQAFEPLK